MPQIKELYLDSEIIVSSVCDFYDVKREKLFTSKRGTFSEPRCAAIYLIRKLRRDGLKEIGLVFMLKKYSSVSSIIERMKSRIKNDRNLKIRIKKLEEQLKKSQEQT